MESDGSSIVCRSSGAGEDGFPQRRKAQRGGKGSRKGKEQRGGKGSRKGARRKEEERVPAKAKSIRQQSASLAVRPFSAST